MVVGNAAIAIAVFVGKKYSNTNVHNCHEVSSTSYTFTCVCVCDCDYDTLVYKYTYAQMYIGLDVCKYNTVSLK